MRRLTFIALALCMSSTALVPAALTAQSDSHLQVHGYLTQAWGIADGGTFAGIPTEGTTDYRTLALLFRYDLGEQDNLTIQLSHRRLGVSPDVVGEPDVKLDWAYYDRQFGAFDVRIGRIPIPAGIYNELRFVGVTLPMYRPPFNFYMEGAFTSETVDGAVARYTLFQGDAWSVDASAYYGSYTMVNRAQIDTQYVPVSANVQHAVGGQAWINTPIDGVRFGGGLSTEDVKDGEFPGRWNEWHASADINLPAVTARAEYRTFGLPQLRYTAYYGSLDLHVTDRFSLHGLADFADFTYYPLPTIKFNKEYAAGVSFAVRPNLVLKGEVHTTNGFWADSPVLDPTSNAPATVRYGIISLSTAF
jgi:hypothetical protein